MDIQRQAFQEWYIANHHDGDIHPNQQLLEWSEKGGFYFASSVEDLWKAWQAAKAQAAPEWISVNDKMPHEGDEVFVHHYGHIVQATKDQKYSGGFKQRNCYGWEAVSSYISHWMPMSVVLPESYHFYYGKPAKQVQEQSHECQNP